MIWITDKAPDKKGHYLVVSALNFYNGGIAGERSIGVAYYDITGNWNRPFVYAWMPLPSMEGIGNGQDVPARGNFTS